MARAKAAIYWKRDSIAGVFMLIVPFFSEKLFYKTPVDGCFGAMDFQTK